MNFRYEKWIQGTEIAIGNYIVKSHHPPTQIHNYTQIIVTMFELKKMGHYY